jgi:hypothetical protein
MRNADTDDGRFKLWNMACEWVGGPGGAGLSASFSKAYLAKFREIRSGSPTKMTHKDEMPSIPYSKNMIFIKRITSPTSWLLAKINHIR